jgi:hypothetical protein
MRNPSQIYVFAWNNREIPKGTEVWLEAVGKLNSALVKTINGGKRYVTDRRALRKCKCGACKPK